MVNQTCTGLRRNKANSRLYRAGREPKGRGENMPNKANLPPGGHHTIPSFHHSSIPSRPRLYETNPISSRAGWGAAWGDAGRGVLYKQTQSATDGPGRPSPAFAGAGSARGLGDATPQRAIVLNKPNFPRAGSPGPTDHAKQSQFGRPRYASIPVFHYSSIPTRCRPHAPQG